MLPQKGKVMIVTIAGLSRLPVSPVHCCMTEDRSTFVKKISGSAFVYEAYVPRHITSRSVV